VSKSGLPLLSPNELKENEEAKRRLRDVIQRRAGLLVVGAGMSTPLGYPDWETLLTKIERLACAVSAGAGTFTCDPTLREESPLDYAENMRRHILNGRRISEYHSLLLREFEPKPQGHTPSHDLLIELRCAGILTPNYDVCLESALLKSNASLSVNLTVDLLRGAEARVSDFLLSLVGRHPPCIAHMHGLYDKPAELILTASQYEQAYGLKVLPDGDIVGGQENHSWTSHRRVIWAMMATRELLFVGFSMKDPYIRAMLTFACDGFWRWGQPVNHIILGLDPENAEETKRTAVAWKEKYATESVFYENPDGKHSALADLLADLVPRSSRTSAHEINQRFMKVTDRAD